MRTAAASLMNINGKEPGTLTFFGIQAIGYILAMSKDRKYLPLVLTADAGCVIS